MSVESGVSIEQTGLLGDERKRFTEQPLFFSDLLSRRWLIHPLFWGLYIVFFALTGGDTFLVALQYELLLLPVKMLVVYTTIYLLIPKLFLPGNYPAFIITGLIFLVAGGILQRVVIYYVLYPLMYPAELRGELITTYWIVKHSLSIFTVTILASSIKITRYWFEDLKKTKALREQKLAAELKFLKAQIHPHFLFNTLNNLYSLTLKQSPDAPEVVLRLSGLMNYMLYDATSNDVSLSREIDSIHDYISLERIRYGDSLDLFFEVTGEVTLVNVAPMLLLPFVENSFKHGVSDEVSDKWIAINLNVTNHVLHFKVENSRTKRSGDTRPMEYTGGIGLKNVRRRLELIYPDRHELKIFEEEDSYLISLKINLDPS